MKRLEVLLFSSILCCFVFTTSLWGLGADMDFFGDRAGACGEISFPGWSLEQMESGNVGVAAAALAQGDSLEVPPALREVSGHRHHHETYYSERESSSWADVLFDLFIGLWALNNLSVTYDDYPYCNDFEYVTLSLDGPDIGQFYRYALDASAGYGLPWGLRYGARLEGMIFKFFGPVFEIQSAGVHPVTWYPFYVDFDSFRVWKGELKLGLEMAIFQTNFLSAFWYIQWAHLFDSEVSRHNGLSLGLILRSYPFRPLLLEWRLLCDIFDFAADEADAVQSHLELGFMLSSPAELFVAWVWERNSVYGYSGHGGEVGVRWHF